MTDLERFMQEIDRLRKKAEAGGSPPPPAKVPAPAKPKPVVATPVERSSKRIAADEPPVVPVVVPVARAVVTPPVTDFPSSRAAVAPVAKVTAVAVPTKPQGTPLTPTGPRVPQRNVMSITGNLTTMLGNRQSLAAAIMLHEILGPPRCRR
jgi:hypothetical protein